MLHTFAPKLPLKPYLILRDTEKSEASQKGGLRKRANTIGTRRRASSNDLRQFKFQMEEVNNNDEE